MATRSWTDAQLVEAAKNSSTIAECLRALGFNALGAHYKELKKHMKRLNLTLSQIKKPTNNIQKPLEKVLVRGGINNTHKLKLRLIKEGLLKNECAGCAINTWTSKITSGETRPLSLHLDHIDGDNTNNTLENLRVLCPNCHAQTSTYCAKNRKVGKVYRSCFICKKTISGRISRCEECLDIYKANSKWPSPGSLLEMFKTKGLNQVATLLKKDPYTIHRHIKALGLLEEYNALRDLRNPSYKNRLLKKGITNNRAKETPTKEELEKLVWETPTTELAQRYGISDVALSKWCKKYGISKPPRGYWAKQYSSAAKSI